MSIYEQILTNKANGQKMFALLIDPEKCSDEWLCQIFNDTENINLLNFVFVGGSQFSQSIYDTVDKIKAFTSAPVVMFPGNAAQFAENVDALLFLSLASGRNAEYLIEQHIQAAPLIKKSDIETIPTGYILINGGKQTAVERVSHTTPYDTKNIELIKNTALACQLLGHKMIYLEAGSGADTPISQDIIENVNKTIDIPLIVGGGIKSVKEIKLALKAGADLVVVGNHIENHPEDLSLLLNAIIF